MLLAGISPHENVFIHHNNLQGFSSDLPPVKRNSLLSDVKLREFTSDNILPGPRHLTFFSSETTTELIAHQIVSHPPPSNQYQTYRTAPSPLALLLRHSTAVLSTTLSTEGAYDMIEATLRYLHGANYTECLLCRGIVILIASTQHSIRK